ncbi:MAG: hypothetical protein AAGA58_01945 [Verrucomicrobiota bacterium]
MKNVFSSVPIFLLSLGFLTAEEQSICPIMIDTEIDEEEVFEYEGTKVFLCCSSCAGVWEDNAAYYVKVGIEEGLLPQFSEMPKKLKDLELMEQRFCPLRNECVVTPESPSIEYNGKKIYFFKERDIERRWNKDPDAAFEEAREKGLLPQFDEKKDSEETKKEE